jgi:predicted glycogen debranching enzyme
MDESIIVGGKSFNLGIHCYGDIYEPRGHKYIVDFDADPVPMITYKVGAVVLTKRILMVPESNQVMLRYDLVKAPGPVKLELKPFLSFRRVHDLTHQNPDARTLPKEIPGGVAFNMYEGFPDLNLQLSGESSFEYHPYWYNGITYSDEMRRGFDCREDLFVPGWFTAELRSGGSVIVSASADGPDDPAALKRRFSASLRKIGPITSFHDQLVRNADLLIRERNGRKQVVAGYSWLYTGLLRETLKSLAGLTLYAKHSPKEFEEVLDNLIEDNQERLFSRTTQVEAPLYMTVTLQQYIAYAGVAKHVWTKYGDTLKGIIESYAPGCRKEVSMQPDGLLWAQVDGVALSWMNTYIDGKAVTERAGYQVETNALWYNALCFAIDNETRYGSAGSGFVRKWAPIRDMVKQNFQPKFWDPWYGFMADYVDNEGRHMELRPNQLWAVSLDYVPVDDEVTASVMRVIGNELVTRRGIRSLSPRDVRYKGVYEGTQVERDFAYYNGCAFPDLLAQYAYVNFRMSGAAFIKKAEWLTKGFYEDLSKHGVGTFSELYDGDPPHEPHGAISSATATAALLNVAWLINKYKEAKQ